MNTLTQDTPAVVAEQLTKIYGSGNTEVVEVYCEKVLLPARRAGNVIVLDNARFHQALSTQKLVEAAGCQLL